MQVSAMAIVLLSIIVMALSALIAYTMHIQTRDTQNSYGGSWEYSLSFARFWRVDPIKGIVENNVPIERREVPSTAGPATRPTRKRRVVIEAEEELPPSDELAPPD